MVLSSSAVLCRVMAVHFVAKLHIRFYDKEERVRMEVVKAVCEAAAQNFELVPKMVRSTHSAVLFFFFTLVCLTCVAI